MSEQQLNRIDKRLIRIEEMLKEVINEMHPPVSKRMTEKEVIAEYDVSINILRRLRKGYKRSDGMKIPPMLFKWGCRKNRNFTYDREELDTVLKPTIRNL